MKSIELVRNGPYMTVPESESHPLLPRDVHAGPVSLTVTGPPEAQAQLTDPVQAHRRTARRNRRDQYALSASSTRRSTNTVFL
jgi:hypothetical protein